MRVQSFLIIDGLVSCTHSFPMLEKNGEKRALKEGYAPSLRILLQVGAGSTEGPRKETPAEAIGAHLFWRIRGCLFDVSNLRRKISEICFGLRFLLVAERFCDFIIHFVLFILNITNIPLLLPDDRLREGVFVTADSA